MIGFWEVGSVCLFYLFVFLCFCFFISKYILLMVYQNELLFFLF